MTDNLLRNNWTDLDSAELRLLLDKRIGGPGQYDDRFNNPKKLYLPLAGSSCRIALTFRKKKIVTIEPGQAFDASEWDRVSEEIENSIRAGPMKVGRDYIFSSFRVPGSWQGERAGGEPAQHEVPGATRRFKDFFDNYAPGAALAKRRDDMYSLRSGILHGSELMQLDQDLAFGWDPPWSDERELYEDLWGLTRVALRNWLKELPAT